MTSLSERLSNLSPKQQEMLQTLLLQHLEAVGANDEIIQRQENGPALLSFAQQRLWFLDQLEPDSAAYNIPTAVRLAGQLDVAALEQSLVMIVQRHETLRTTFATRNGRPFQAIAPDLSVNLPVLDLQAVPEAVREAEVRRLATREARRPFDLQAGPLMRVTLLRLNERDHVLLLNMHHIVSDGWSTGILVREVTVLYEAFAGGKPARLPELPIQYADYAAWQREWLQGETLEAELGYWKAQLEGAPTVLDLPTDRPRPPRQTYRGDTLELNLSQDLTGALRGLGQADECTLFMTLLAALGVMLHRYTGQEDILVGSPIANRSRAEIEGLIGFFANTLVLRIRMEDNPSFLDVLRQVRETTLEAYAHQDVPFEMLVDALKVERDLSRSPLFQVMLVLQNAPMEPLEMPGLTFSPLEASSGAAMFDLTLSMVETEQGLMGVLEYGTDLFDVATIERIAGHLETLLESIVADPAQRISDLALLTEAEHQQLQAWNETATAYPEDKCIHELFEEQVERTPDAVAVVACSSTGSEHGGDQYLTYQELNQRANRLAHCLRRLGVGPEMLVGLCIDRSIEMIVGMLGILKAGGAYVPLDPAYPKDRLAFILQDTELLILLTQQRFAVSLPACETKVICLDTAWPEIAEEGVEPLGGEASSQNLAYVIYTSGSTGTPKGALIAHQGLCNLAKAQVQVFDIRSHSRVLQFASMCFDASVSEVFTTLLTGAALYLGTQEALLPGAGLLPTLRDQAITTVTLPPSALTSFSSDGLPDLETVVSAGEPCTADIVAHWASDRRFINAYGPTEGTVCATLIRLDKDEQKPPVGKPMANVEVYILDGDLSPVPVGVAGELHIGGVGLARGYLDRPGLTGARFVPHPYSTEPGARLYRTGDLARYLSDGNVEFLRRMDHQVKIRGFRIELGEIETVLAQHPAVRDAVALVCENKPGDKCLVAYVVGEEGREPGLRELRDFLKEKLPGHMVPSAFVMLEALSLTPNGKVDRKALPALEGSRLEVGEEYVAPRGEAERAIAKVWQEALGLELVGVHDNFFDVGGHSLLIVQVYSRLKAVFEREFPMTDMFKYTTVAALATFLSQTQDRGDIVQQRQERAAARRASLRQRARGRQSAELE